MSFYRIFCIFGSCESKDSKESLTKTASANAIWEAALLERWMRSPRTFGERGHLLDFHLFVSLSFCGLCRSFLALLIERRHDELGGQIWVQILPLFHSSCMLPASRDAFRHFKTTQKLFGNGKSKLPQNHLQTLQMKNNSQQIPTKHDTLLLSPISCSPSISTPNDAHERRDRSSNSPRTVTLAPNRAIEVSHLLIKSHSWLPRARIFPSNLPWSSADTFSLSNPYPTLKSSADNSSSVPFHSHKFKPSTRWPPTSSQQLNLLSINLNNPDSFKTSDQAPTSANSHLRWIHTHFKASPQISTRITISHNPLTNQLSHFNLQIANHT
jgi:hypothetical protein